MIIVRAKSSPFEIMFMVAAVLGGAVLLILRKEVGSTLAKTLPSAITILLAVGLITGGLTTLIGVSLKVILGPLLERAGLGLLALLFLVYSAFTLNFVGLHGVITAVFFLSFAAASGWRIWQISGDLNDTEHVMREATDRNESEG